MARVKLTAARAARIKYDPTGPKSQITWDISFGARNGGSFGLRCYPSGKRTWVLRTLILGREAYTVVGDADTISLDVARSTARDQLTDLQRHDVDPRTGRHVAADEGPTVKALCEQYLTRSEALGKSVAYVADARSKFVRFVYPKFGGLPAIELTKAEVVEMHSNVSVLNELVKGRRHGGPYTANRTIQALKAAYNFAIDAKILPKGTENPVLLKRKEMNREQSRKTFLSRSAVPAFLEALGKESATIQAFFLTAIGTGMRRGELLSLKWSDLNLIDGVAHLARTKNGDQRAVQLPAMITQRLRLLERTNDFVFASTVRKTRPINTVSRAWVRVRTRAGLPALHIHDLRRTFGTWAATSGVSLAVTAATLGHRDHSTTAKIYAMAEVSAARAAAESVAALLNASAAEVIPAR